MAEEVQYEPKPLPPGPGAPFGYATKSDRSWKMQGADNGSGAVPSGREDSPESGGGGGGGTDEPFIDLELCSGRFARVKGYLVPLP